MNMFNSQFSSEHHAFPGLLLLQVEELTFPYRSFLISRRGRAYALIFQMVWPFADGWWIRTSRILVIWDLTRWLRRSFQPFYFALSGNLLFRSSFCSGYVDSFGVRVSIKFNMLRLLQKRAQGDPFLIDYTPNILFATSHCTSLPYTLLVSTSFQHVHIAVLDRMEVRCSFPLSCW